MALTAAEATLLEREAGVGKTALVRRFCARRAGAARLLWGECDGLFTLSPLGPLVDIAEVTGGELGDLVADGLRNRDIAERLFLSTKTVEHHVAAILAKLGARTRGEAGAQALKHGLLGQDKAFTRRG